MHYGSALRKHMFDDRLTIHRVFRARAHRDLFGHCRRYVGLPGLLSFFMAPLDLHNPTTSTTVLPGMILILLLVPIIYSPLQHDEPCAELFSYSICSCGMWFLMQSSSSIYTLCTPGFRLGHCRRYVLVGVIGLRSFCCWPSSNGTLQDRRDRFFFFFQPFFLYTSNCTCTVVLRSVFSCFHRSFLFRPSS